MAGKSAKGVVDDIRLSTRRVLALGSEHKRHQDFTQCGDDECMHSIDRSLQDEQRSRQQDLLKKTSILSICHTIFFLKKIFAIHAVDYSPLRGLKSDYIIEIKDRLS